MNFQRLSQHRWFRPAVGATITIAVGLLLWKTPLGDGWVNASYDYLFRFGARAPTNDVVLVLMDDEAFFQLHQAPNHWDRTNHTELLNKLADDGCPLVVFDVLFTNQELDPQKNKALATAMAQQKAVVLAANLVGAEHPDLESARLELAADIFVEAARTNYGVALFHRELDSIVRKHWPSPSPGLYPSLAWAAAVHGGAKLSPVPEERWLRYYSANRPAEYLSYHFALGKPVNYFRNKIVFVGQKTEGSMLGMADDKFNTPQTRWTGKTVAGVELHATSFVNLMNGDWLRRPHWILEATLMLLGGLVFGGVLCWPRPLVSCALAGVAAIAIAVGAISSSYYGNYWFPWLVVVAAQMPCGLAWALGSSFIGRQAQETADPMVVPIQVGTPGTAPLAQPAGDSLQALPPHFSGWDTVLGVAQGQDLPDAPDYELFHPPFGEGGFGKVWLARNAIGQWQALKAVYQVKFGHRTGPFEAEFKGIKRYKPISDKHPGLLRVDFVSKRKEPGYFYYVMELGDAQEPGWEQEPGRYQPRDLARARSESPGGRIPVPECIRIALVLTEALGFLHGQGLTHRDIKPSNIVFVNGQPKLTDVGLVTELRLPDEVTSWAGSPGYMPPPPEPPGTAQADIYAMGMVLFVISTGCDPSPFPVLSRTLADMSKFAALATIKSVILKACQPDCNQRYKSAAELRRDLLLLQKAGEPPRTMAPDDSLSQH